MSTRSNIGYLHPLTAKLTYIYCHLDGYLDGVGYTLLDNYQTLEQVMELVGQGDASSISDTIDESVFYHTWRDEPWENVKPKTVDTLREYEEQMMNDIFIEYPYVFIGGRWFYLDKYETKLWQEVRKPKTVRPSGYHVHEGSDILHDVNMKHDEVLPE